MLEEVFNGTSLSLDDMANVIATGYGRFNVSCAKGEISEITCHAKGALLECPGTTTILDIGGQDVKAIKLDAQGVVTQFAMNDKCAAGTGRFLDVMSKVLEIPMDQMGDWYFKSKSQQRSAVLVRSLQNQKSYLSYLRISPKKILLPACMNLLRLKHVHWFVALV